MKIGTKTKLLTGDAIEGETMENRQNIQKCKLSEKCVFYFPFALPELTRHLLAYE